MNRFGLSGLAVLVFSTQQLVAQPVIETFDRFEMNWSTMKLRYFGESAVGKTLDLAEKEATDQGLLYALANVPKIRTEKGVPVENAGDIANAVTKQSYAYNTVYFSNGKVRVELESSLALALDPGRKPFTPKAVEGGESGSGNQSVVVEVSGASSPTLIKEIVDSSGELAYSSQDVSPEAYRKSLTGRWFYPNSSELKSFAGDQAVRVKASFQNGKLVVDKAAWEEARSRASKSLADGRVAFVLSSTN
ncbi:MAG: hypothetical protein EOP10_26290 [Proteobacteria bacterium]|nr:MAG: hypothetical protein EOP10_26290 [Pseudomonadota bacterium]